MVAIVENWSDIEGVVVDLDDSDLERLRFGLDLLLARDVAGYPNLLAARVGERLECSLPRTASSTPLRIGSRLTCRLRRDRHRDGGFVHFIAPDSLRILP